MPTTDWEQAKIHPGMIVRGGNGDRLGTVKKVDEDGLWIDLEARPDTRVPFSAIQEVVEKFVRLNIPGD